MAMARTIVIIATLDTKEPEVGYLKECIERRGHKAVVMDVSMAGEPSALADISNREIAEAGEGSIDEIRVSRDRDSITQTMIRGASQKAKELHSAGQLDGIISFGGSTGAMIGTSVMKALPFGVPKLFTSSNLAMPYGHRYFGVSDIMGMSSPFDIANLCGLVKSVLARSAGAICGMVEALDDPVPTVDSSKPMIAMSEWGYSWRCCRCVEKKLTEKGYQVVPFHANGVGDRAMEGMLGQGFFEAVVDIVPGGVANELLGGTRAAGPDRLETAGRRGIPQVVSPSGLSLIGVGPWNSMPPEYLERKLHKLDDLRISAKVVAEEAIAIARTTADKLNRANGSVRVLIPLRGWTDIDREGQPTYEPSINDMLLQELKRCLRPEIKVEEIDAHLEDPDFCLALVTAFDELMKGTESATPDAAVK